MKLKFKEIIYSQLKEAQEKYGGYTGKDIATISRRINRQPKTVRRHIGKLREEDASFSNFTYIGKQYIDLTLDEISFLQYKLQNNCLMLKSLLLEELNKRRIEEGKSRISQSTFYRFLENHMHNLGIDENDPYRWLKTKGINVTEKYSIENARASIQTLFSFRDLKNRSVADLEGINDRVKKCEKWLEENYTGVGNIIRHYDRIKKRKHKLRSLLASIKSDESIAIQVRLIFEIQVCFFVDLLDFLIEEQILNNGRIYRLMSDKRAKVENRLRKERLSRVGVDISDLFHGHIEKEKLFNRFTSQISIETLARVVLLKSHKSAYSMLLNILRSLTANFSEDVIEIHHDTAKVIIKLLRGDKTWNSLDVKQKQSILRDEDLVGIIDEGAVLACILTNRVINHIKSGKITFKNSHQFRDMGALIESLPISEEEYTISLEMLNEMLENKLEITAEPYPEFNFASESEMEDSIKRVYFQHVMDKVVERVKENNPDWFDMHKEVFFETTDYMFELTYDENTFRKQFYEALGFMSRNFRYRDDERFLPLKYFISRYISEQSLDLEHYFLHNTLLKLTDTNNSLVIPLYRDYSQSETFHISCWEIECNVLHTNRAHLPFYPFSPEIYNPHHQQYQF